MGLLVQEQETDWGKAEEIWLKKPSKQRFTVKNIWEHVFLHDRLYGFHTKNPSRPPHRLNGVPNAKSRGWPLDQFPEFRML